ncbi:MAG: LysM peptidoglycan-binding domain-containing protein [Hahellaceae bacterium]|nr:LysM peptidoglycan-binding domain-containing protein [Hahellaceae bacterium]
MIRFLTIFFLLSLTACSAPFIQTSEPVTTTSAETSISTSSSPSARLEQDTSYLKDKWQSEQNRPQPDSAERTPSDMAHEPANEKADQLTQLGQYLSDTLSLDRLNQWLAGPPAITVPKVAQTKPLPNPVEDSPKSVGKSSSDCDDIDCETISEHLFSAPSESQRTFQPDLWHRIRKGFSLNHDVKDARLQQELNWYSTHPQYLERTAKRAERYIHYIVEQAEEKNMPLELALLPIVESAFDPFAYSHGRASGIWQFIPSTGKMYGLKQDWWYDGRRDIVASTEAALSYLQSLANQFDGDWTLALASYNSGAGTVARAIRNNKKRGKPVDFWSLNLPKETEAYVPKLLAIAKIIATPDDYNVELYPIPDEPYFQIVKLNSQIDLAHAADLAEIDVDEIYMLNPGFNRWATSPTGPHHLAIPLENVEVFEDALTQLTPKQQLNWRRYSVQSGDSLISIAKQYRTTPDVIRQVNNLSGHQIKIGQALLIPVAAQNQDFYSFSQNNRLKKKQSLSPVNKSASKLEYTVRSGDTFWDLSRKYKVGVRSLAKWNGMAPGDPLRPGQKLVIWTSSSPGKSGIFTGNRESKVRKVVYMVRSGDSIAGIAQKFNVSSKNVISWNNLNPKKYLKPGQKLTLYVNVTGG